jgi:hypothetical protein
LFPYEQKNPVLFTLFNRFDHPNPLGHGMGSIFLEKNSIGSDGGLSKDGRRGWDGGYQHPYLELHQF